MAEKGRGSRIASLLEEAERKRREIVSDRETLQAQYDLIGLEIAACDTALHALDRLLAKAPVENGRRSPRKETLTDVVLTAMKEGPCARKELEDRVRALSDSFNIKSVDGVVRALVKRGLVRTTSNDGPAMYALVVTSATG